MLAGLLGVGKRDQDLLLPPKLDPRRASPVGLLARSISRSDLCAPFLPPPNFPLGLETWGGGRARSGPLSLVGGVASELASFLDCPLSVFGVPVCARPGSDSALGAPGRWLLMGKSAP